MRPPSLVIDDGTTTLVLRPADGADGLADAADFAEELVHVASEWESGCRRTLATTQPDHPDDTQVPAAEPDHPAPTPGSRQQPASCTINPDEQRRVTTRSAPKPARRTALIAARKACGFTQQALAARLGVERSTLCRWETGKTAPRPTLWPELARLLNLDDNRLSALLGEPVDQAPQPPAPKSSTATRPTAADCS